MPITLDGTVGGDSLEARGEARATVEFLVALLRRGFGDDPRILRIARGLAVLPPAEAVETVLAAPSLDELDQAEPE